MTDPEHIAEEIEGIIHNMEGVSSVQVSVKPFSVLKDPPIKAGYDIKIFLFAGFVPSDTHRQADTLLRRHFNLAYGHHFPFNIHVQFAWSSTKAYTDS